MKTKSRDLYVKAEELQKVKTRVKWLEEAIRQALLIPNIYSPYRQKLLEAALAEEGEADDSGRSGSGVPNPAGDHFQRGDAQAYEEEHGR